MAGAAAYRRGSENIRRQITEEQAAKANDPVHVLTVHCGFLQERNTELKQKLAETEATLVRAQNAMNRARAERDVLSAELTEVKASSSSRIAMLTRQLARMVTKWELCSLLIREYVTPAQVEEAREYNASYIRKRNSIAPIQQEIN